MINKRKLVHHNKNTEQTVVVVVVLRTETRIFVMDLYNFCFPQTCTEHRKKYYLKRLFL